ncbi:hypothetical protein MWU59_00495 [Flavobacteriaceae bacterium F08102]|nr:hypothetical protein [Flavobacteriaceae bacterium F08102]
MKKSFLKAPDFTLILCYLLMISGVFTACNTSESTDYNTPINVKKLKEHLITVGQAVDGYQRYSKERIHLTQDTLKQLYGKDFNDTRMVRFDIETIKSYIAYVEKMSAKKGLKPEGLQFYFSVHPNSGKQANHQSFFIAPTVENNGTQSGYTIVKKGDSTEIIFLKSLLSDGRNTSNSSSQIINMSKASFFNFAQEDEEDQDGEDDDEDLDGLIMNMGSGTPPGE